MEKLLIIDSNSILNRAFYGIRYLAAKDGTPTNAIYGFFNILLKLINDEQPDYLCAAFDVKAPTFRHKQFEEYKAQRKPMPEGLAQQLPLAKELLHTMDIPVLELAGYEADDIIGTVARLCEEKEISCRIATGDKDDLQLATDKTQVILTVTRQGVNETTIYDDQAVFERYGVTPKEFIDIKALMGDPSDNIPGVPGIGEKTAMKLIAEHKSIENIYNNIDGIGLKGAMLQKMKDGKELAFMSKELATIDTKVPVSIDFDRCRFSGFHSENEALYSLLRKLELNSLMKRMNITGAPAAEAVPAEDIFEKMELVSPKSSEELKAVGEEIRNLGEVSCLLSFAGNALISCGLSYGEKAVSLKAGAVFSQRELLDFVLPILSEESIRKYTFDIKESVIKLSAETQIKGVACDCAIAAYLVDPAKTSYTIEELCHDLLHVTLDANTSSGEQMSLLEEENDQTEEMDCKRVYAIRPLWKKLQARLKENGQEALYEEIELPLVFVLAKMQIRGFRIDGEELKRFGDRLETDIRRITTQIYEYAGEEFNINSPKQLGVILFEKLGLPAGKKTKTGYGTGVDILEKLKEKHPIIPLLMEFRQLSKLKSTYCDGLAAVTSPETGKIHSAFNQTVTVTGRISSTEPNMQNIPTRTALGRELRKMFIASDEEHVLVDADYSQIELRVLAHISDDPVMINAFRSEEDIHAVTASQVFHVPLDQVTKEQRGSAKAVNFGIVYGIGEFSLSQDLKISVRQAKEYIDKYLEKYEGVHRYMNEIKEQAKKDGYVKTMMNRIRYIPELKSSNFNVRSFGERVALNTPIQGTAADIIKLAMVRVENRLSQENLKSKLILQVHDELIIDAYKTEQEQVCRILKEEMEHAMELRVPLVVDLSTGRSWYDAK